MATSSPDMAGPGFADRLRDATQALHTRAERTGFVAALLRGEATTQRYALWLQNLRAVYSAMERALEQHRGSPRLDPLARPEVFRAEALAADLAALGFGDLPTLPATQAYLDCVEAASRGEGQRLVVHAYVRYLGDLNGGRVVGRLLRDKMGLNEDALSFYAYPAIADLDGFKRDYREAIDEAGRGADEAMLIDEARSVFEHNVALSLAVQEADLDAHAS